METDQGIQDGQGALGHSYAWPRDANRLEDLPFVDHFVWWSCRRGHLCRYMGKRQRPPPKGRRGLMGLHAFAFQLGKEKLLAKTTIVTRHLTVNRGSGILVIAK
jgi:hypothetical protein